MERYVDSQQDEAKLDEVEAKLYLDREESAR
jgi:hypothetical protein